MSTRPLPPSRGHHDADTEPQPTVADAPELVPGQGAPGAKRRPLHTISSQPDPEMVLAGLPDAITSYDRDWRIVHVNPRAAELLQRSPAELLGRSIRKLLRDDSSLKDAFVGAMEEQRPSMVEEFSPRLGRWFEHRLLPTPHMLTVVSRDVTDRRNAEHTRETLLEVARATAAAHGTDDLLDEVQRLTRSALACDAVATVRFDDSTGMFRFVSQVGCAAGDEADLHAITFLPYEPFGGELAHGPVVAQRDTAPEAVRKMCERFGWSTVLVAPMRLRGQQLGAVLTAFRDPAREIQTWETELCAGIARQLAVAIARTEAQRSQSDDAEIAATLAHLGQSLLASFDRPNLLDRICDLTARAIGCARCTTFLWRAEDDTFDPVAQFGMELADAEEVRLLGMRASAVPKLVRRLSEEGVFVQSEVPPEELEALPSRLRPESGAVLLLMALHRGEQLIGFLVATHDPAERPFTNAQLRIARGAVQRASMAIEHGLVLEQLERATQLKSDFVAMLSHELRTPLHIILGYGDLLLDDAFGKLDEGQRDALRRIQRSGKDLLEQVRGLLDLNRLETGRTPLAIAEVAPADLVAEVERYCADVDRAPGVVFQIGCEPDMDPVSTDRAKVVTILRNLIGNAFKFTRAGRVDARIERASEGFCLSVSDTGDGIVPETLPHIFEPFRQGDAAATRTLGGVGLGLYIVNRMVEALGGWIDVDSAPGRGSTFRVILPDGRRPRLDDHGLLQTVLATTNGQAAVLDADGTVIAVNDRWLRYPAEVGATPTEHLGVGTNYFTVCAHVVGPDATVAADASRGIHEVIDGRREQFTLDYGCDTPVGRIPYRLKVSALAGPLRHALVAHFRLGPAEAVKPA